MELLDTDWHEFFVAAAGAAAALSGLIFVAVSINLATILAEEKKLGSSYLTGRALESVVLLRLILAWSLVAAYIIAGVTLILQAGGGLDWLPFAFILAVSIAASNAWILLVEVLR